MSAAPRRRRWAWVAGIVVVLLVAACAGWWVQLQRPADPAATATRFWQLLAEGKAQDALALTSTPAASLPNAVLLTNAVYGKADRGIAHVEAHSFTQRGDQASGTIQYTQNGTQRTVRLTLELAHNGFLARPTWQITNAPLTRVQVTVASGGQASALAVDGTSLPLPDGDGTVIVPALPGTYTFTLGVSNGLFTAVPQKVTATGADASVRLGVTPSSTLGTQAVAQAQAAISGCFAQPTLSSDCLVAQGIRNIFNLTAEPSVTYQLTRTPQLAFDAQTMRVVSTSDGEITTTQSDPRNGYFHNVAGIAIALDVAVKDGKIVLTPDQGGVQNTNGVCVNAAC